MDHFRGFQNNRISNLINVLGTTKPLDLGLLSSNDIYPFEPNRTESPAATATHRVTELDIIDLIIISVLEIRLLVKSRVFEDRLRSSEANEGVNEQRTRVVLREAEGSRASTLSQPTSQWKEFFAKLKALCAKTHIPTTYLHRYTKVKYY